MKLETEDKVTGGDTVWSGSYDYLLVILDCCTIFEISAHTLVDKCNLFESHMYLTAPLKALPSEFLNAVLVQKTRITGLPRGGENFDDTCSCLDAIATCDIQTDRRTDLW